MQVSSPQTTNQLPLANLQQTSLPDQKLRQFRRECKTDQGTVAGKKIDSVDNCQGAKEDDPTDCRQREQKSVGDADQEEAILDEQGQRGAAGQRNRV